MTNCRPRSEVMSIGRPKQENHPERRALVLDSAVVSTIRMAAGQRVKQSMMVKK